MKAVRNSEGRSMDQLLEQGIAVLRVSGEDQKKGYGWDVQQEHIEAFAEEHGIAMARFIKFQERATTLDREEFEAILDEIIGEARRGSIQWVLFGRANRLNRHDWSWMDYLSRLFRAELKIGLALENKVLTAEACQDAGFVLGLVSDMVSGAQEARTWRVVSLAGRKRRAKDGRLPTGDGGLWPYRYIPGKKPGQGIREIIPQRAEWCRKWLEWLREGVKGNEIARRMTKEGVPPSRSREWGHPTIFGILKNKALRGNTEVWGIPIPNATPAIFTEEEGVEIDRILKVNKDRAARNCHRTYELRQHVFCACGHKMWGDTSIQQRGRYVYGRYKCPRCHRSVDKVWLEEQAKAALVPIFSDKKHLEAYLETEGNSSEKARSRLDLLEVQIRRKLTVLDNLKRQHAWGDWGDAEYIYERDKVKAGLVELQEQKAETEAAYRAALAQDADSRALERLAAEVGDRLASARGSLLTQLYDVLGLRVTVDDDVVHISVLAPLQDFEVEDRACRSCFHII